MNAELKNNCKRFGLLLLVVVLLLSLFPVNVHAANVETGVAGLTADSSGNATWTTSGGAITGSVSANKTSGCTGDTFTKQDGMLTFTNVSNAPALLSFNYELGLNGGSAKVDGADVTAGANFSKRLEMGETVVVVIASNETNEIATTITIHSISLVEEKNVDITFKTAINGSYTVDGEAIDVEMTKTILNTADIALAATPISGYQFLGWYNETTNSYLTNAAAATVKFPADATIEPVFVESGLPIFQVGMMYYIDLEDAINYAQNNGISKIALVGDGTLPAGNYTIPSGKTLVIPFDEAQTVYTTAPGMTVGSDGKPAAHVEPSAFRTLTMASGAKITVASGGAVSVPSMLSAVGTNSGSWNATPTGKHGRIAMNDGSSIDVQSGGKLYVYGYISGSGNVYARSGSEVWECFQIRCWRGGTATSNMADNTQKVFPLNQYYVQNIEAPLTYYPGATEKVFAAVNMSNQQFGASATFVGSGGMFQLSNGSMTKRFTGASDRLELAVEGDFAVNAMSLTITGLPLVGTLNLNTENYVLPIQSNITLNVNSGTTTVNQDVAFLPGSEMTIANGANVTVASGHKAYVYDKDQWGAYAADGLQLVPVGYSTVNGTTAKRNANSLVDAKIDVNGMLNVAGALYTTKSGAAIVSTGGTGKVILAAEAGTETNTYMATQSGSDISYVSIPITAAKLQHMNGSYLPTSGKAAGTEIPYEDGWWGGCAIATFQNYDGTVLASVKVAKTMTPEVPEAAQNPTRPAADEHSYVFSGWEPALGPITEDTTYVAQFKPAYTVVWEGEDGTPLQVSEVAEGEHPVYDGATPTKPEDAQYTYTFDKWMISETDEEYTDATVVTGDMTLYPEFTAVRKTLTVTFHANNGTDVTTTQTMNTVESTPLKANTFTYKNHAFLGWSDSATGEKVYNDTQSVEFDGNADLYAVWQRTAVEITFNANADDAQGSMDAQTVSVDGGELNANAFSREGYTFAGWNTKADGSGSAYVDKATFNGDEDITLYAQWEIKTYTIRFVDENGDLIGSEQTVEHGKMPAVPTPPEKAADAQYTYAFNGWSPAVAAATEDATYTVTYSSTLRSYTITWKDDAGNVIDTTTVAYGVTPTHDNPSKAADAQYTYSFREWSPAVTAVTGDAEYTAVFDQTVNKYTVKFVNDDGTVLQSSEVEYGTVPTYEGETPTKASTDQYQYTFAGWNKELVAVTGEATYTAVYTSEVRSYTITWVIDGETETQTLAYGETPSHADPSKAADAQYTYSFKEWNPAIAEVTGDATYTAVFDTTLNQYTVKFLNEDGSEAKSETLDYGAAITAPADPVKPNTHEKIYTFLGWFDENDVQWSDGATVTGEAVYTARFGEQDQLYTVIWLDANGEQLKKVEGVLFNAIPEYDGETPVKEADAQYTYKFANWSDPALDEATFTYTITPVFDATPVQYTVTFVIDGEEHPAPYLYGEMPAYDGTPEKPADAQYTYTFKEWSPAITEVTGDATYTAVFDATVNTYTVKWIIDGEETSETYAYGATPSHADPAKEANAQYTYTFKEWSPAIAEVTGDVTYTAMFEETVNTYTITFVNDDGTQLDSKTVAYGEMPSTDVVPVKADTLTKTYAFAGWTPELAAVTGDVTYTATYTETERTGWVSFDGKLYFIADGEPVTGIARLPYPDASFGYVEDPEAVNDAGYPNDAKGTFILGEDGALQSDVNGFYTFETANENTAYKTDWLVDGSTVWVVNGEILWHPGEVKVDGDYYYFASANTMIKGRDYNVTRVHDLQLRGKYTFSDEGKVMMYDGITNVNGKDYYYVNGVKTYAGLVKIGDDLYYINSACEVVKSREYYVSKTNGLLPAGKYSFDDTGKLIVDAPTLNGIVKETAETWYYYVDGVKAYAGLVEIDGSLYYVNSAFQVIHGRDYYVSKTNGLKPQGTYTFDADGKLVEKDTSLNGIVKDGDTWYYYVDGVKTYAGLVEIDGALYYVKTDKTVVHGQEYYVSKTNGLKDAGKYTFDADGKLVDLNGIVKDGDVWTYYVNGNKTYAGLIEIDGALYYVKSDCTVVHGQDYYVSKTNGQKEAGKYTFDADGKLVDLNGIVKNGDVWTYYVNGAKTYAGLIVIDGALYYVKSDCTVVHGQSYAVSKTNGLKAQGTYTFDSDGKLIENP